MVDLQADIAIIGGGPGGAAAAIEAAGRGLDVVVVDKTRFPRDKCCGDGLTTGALRHLDQLGFDPAAVPSWRTVTTVSVRTPAGRRRLFPLPDPEDGDGGVFGAVARRRQFDAALLDLARRSGAVVREGHELIGLHQDRSRVAATVVGPDGPLTIEARYVIAADGMWSPTRKLLGIDTGRYRGDWHAFRQYFTNVTGLASRHLFVWFEPDLLPGYAWSFPVDTNSANVGFGILRRQGQSVQAMKELWPRLLQRAHVVEALGTGAEPEAPHRAWPIPTRLGKLPIADGRVLFVGDALAAGDPMTGEGIGQAIETGRSAVAAVTDADRTSLAATVGDKTAASPAAVRDRYEHELRRGMMRDHRLAAGLSGLLSTSRGVDAAVSIAGATSWSRSNFARWLFEDYPRASLATPRRWRRGLFSSPGAFAGR